MENQSLTTDKELEVYTHFLTQNHLFEHSLGDASFNPGMLLMFQQKTNSKLIDLLCLENQTFRTPNRSSKEPHRHQWFD